MHGPLKDSYSLRSNFREFAEQVISEMIDSYVQITHCSIFLRFFVQIIGSMFPDISR
jgi:hypothetical protein